jgi:hypothetical protein
MGINWTIERNIVHIPKTPLHSALLSEEDRIPETGQNDKRLKTFYRMLSCKAIRATCRSHHFFVSARNVS